MNNRFQFFRKAVAPSSISGQYIDYSAKAPQAFKDDLKAALIAYDAAMNGAKYTPVAAGSAITLLNAIAVGLKSTAIYPTYQLVVNCLDMGIPVVATFIVTTCNITSQSDLATAKDLRAQGITNGYFNTVPILLGDTNTTDLTAEAASQRLRPAV